MFFDVNQQYCLHESMEFPTDLLYQRQFEAIVPILRSRRTPCKLRLDSGCVSSMIHAMETGVRIGSLKILGPRVFDEDVERLLSAENSQLVLELEFNSIRLSRRGYEAFATFLRRESTTIEKLDFGRILLPTLLDVDCAHMLLRSIPSGSTLRHIELGRLYQHGDDDSYDRVVKTLKTLICDESSFDALCGSNHRLRHVGRDPGARVTRSKVLREALEINGREGRSVNQKCRSKLRFFFFRGEFDVRPFARMDVAFMPNVLELVTMSEERIVHKKRGRAEKGTYVTARNGHLGCIYRLVRNCHLPELFCFPSQQVEIEQLRAKNAELETTIGSLKQNIEWLNDKLLYMCAPTDYYTPNKLLKRRRAKQ